ncbi:MAG: imidazolonepropionase [Mesorhizobium sp.]|nr:MAG: imidazolonepropionase [Mesorhizobium sp.]
MMGGANGKSGLRLWRNARLATMAEGAAGLGIVEKGAIAARDGLIVYAGSEADLPAAAGQGAETVDCQGRWITPGLIDCHTHLVYAGNRANEFEMRLAGATYEVARAGGGIVSSVKSLRAARRLASERPITILTTCLAAHALPPEARGDKDAFIDLVAGTILPAVAAEKLADAVDGFCEGIAFSPEQIARVFDKAKALGLPVKLHADQLSNLHGAALAARYGALSADHLEYTDEEGAAAMAGSGTVATILPGAYYFIRETKRPPVDLFRRHGVKMAVATDSNPGTSPLTSLLLTMNMAATLFGLTIDECLAGVTREAARALGLLDRTGTLEAGKSADLAVWDIERPAELVYRMGFNRLHARIWRGQ